MPLWRLWRPERRQQAHRVRLCNSALSLFPSLAPLLLVGLLLAVLGDESEEVAPSSSAESEMAHVQIKQGAFDSPEDIAFLLGRIAGHDPDTR